MSAANTGLIRIARDTDADAVQRIYAPSVVSGTETFETELPDVASMRERMRARLPHYPWLVWEEHGSIAAYAYAGRFRERAAYDWIAETSIYVDRGAWRRGIARRLYAALLDLLRLQGISQAVGVITLPGEASIAMHEALGFRAAGVWRQAGFKHGRWLDVGVWQKELQTLPVPPLPVRAFATLAGSIDVEQILGKAAD